MLKLTCLVLTLVLVGCAGSPAEIANRSPEELANSSDRDVAWAYAYHRDSWGGHHRLRAEIDRRKMFSEEDWRDIKAKKVRIGMREEAVWAAWGPPEDSHKLSTGSGTYRTLYYEGSRVYTENGIVTAIGQ